MRGARLPLTPTGRRIEMHGSSAESSSVSIDPRYLSIIKQAAYTNKFRGKSEQVPIRSKRVEARASKSGCLFSMVEDPEIAVDDTPKDPSVHRDFQRQL